MRETHRRGAEDTEGQDGIGFRHHRGLPRSTHPNAMTDNQTPNAVEDLIKRLNLRLHPEGGWFREVHRSHVVLVGRARVEESRPTPASARTRRFSRQSVDPVSSTRCYDGGSRG